MAHRPHSAEHQDQRVDGLTELDRRQNLMENGDIMSDPASDNSNQYAAQFSIDLLLDNQKRVRRTHVIHVQNGVPGPQAEDSWADWNEAKLTKFILKNAVTRSKRKRSEKVDTKNNLRGRLEDKKQATAVERASDLKISDVLIQTASGAVTHWLVKGGEPFTVRLLLNMNRSAISSGMLLQYQAKVSVKNLTGSNHQNVSENNGTILSKGLLPLTINCNALSPGSYRMEAFVSVSLDQKDADPNVGFIAMTVGKIFSVG